MLQPCIIFHNNAVHARGVIVLSDTHAHQLPRTRVIASSVSLHTRLLHRFLSARKYDVQKAGEMLRNHIAWRFGVYRPFEIRCEEMEPCARTGSIQVYHAHCWCWCIIYYTATTTANTKFYWILQLYYCYYYHHHHHHHYY